MPLYADNSSGTRVFALDPVDTTDKFTCPFCDTKMIYVNGIRITKHFRHFEACPYETEPETESHLQMKLWLKEHVGAELEQKIGRRIADGLIRDQGISFECQHSPINRWDLLARTGDHNKQGLAPIWILDWRGLYGSPEQNVKDAERVLQSLNRGSIYYLTEAPTYKALAVGHFRGLVYKAQSGEWVETNHRQRMFSMQLAPNGPYKFSKKIAYMYGERPAIGVFTDEQGIEIRAKLPDRSPIGPGWRLRVN